MTDASLIESLLAAVAARPDDLPLRLHLAQLLLAVGQQAAGTVACSLCHLPLLLSVGLCGTGDLRGRHIFGQLADEACSRGGCSTVRAVTFRKAINRLLQAVTGYELRRVPHRKTAGGKGAKVPARSQPAIEAEPKPKSEMKLPHDYDEAAKNIIRTVKPRTMTSPERLNALIYAVRYIARHQIPGDIVECGVWRGGSMMAIAKTLIEAGDTDRHLHLYDTFEGMSEPTEHDKRHDGRHAAEMLAAATSRSSAIWAYASLEDVQESMRETEYPADRIHYYKGKVEDTIPKNIPDRISILRLDTDWYESTKHELEQLWPRLVPGGVLLLDDYGWWDGARRAVDEWLEEMKLPLLLLRMDVGRLAVKPPATWNHTSDDARREVSHIDLGHRP